MTIEIYLAYVLACLVITIIPGPTVTLIVANSLTHGTRAGLLNVLGTQFGLGLMMLVLAVGLTSLIATMGFWFDWLRLLGAAYLIWLGWKLLRSSGGLARPSAASRAARRFRAARLSRAARQSEGACSGSARSFRNSSIRRAITFGRLSCWG